MPEPTHTALSRKPIVLVLCTGNSCRSQMAEGFLRKFHGDVFEVHGAGTDPAAAVHPLAIKVMAEVGIDIADGRPKNSSEFLGRLPVKHLMLVCDRASQTCPRVWPGALTRHSLPFEDPAHATGTDEEILAFFRRVRDEIEQVMNVWKPQQEGGQL